MNTIYSHDIRTLLCENCSAPIQADPNAGMVQCQYCGAQNQLRNRQETEAPIAVPQQQVNEQDRLMRLRAQDGKPLLTPPALQGLVEGNRIPDWKIQEAIAVFQATRNEVRATNNYEAAERLMYLTLVMSNYFVDKNDQVRRRAMFESVLEVVSLPRHRQTVRGYLSRAAVLENDLRAAEEWLAPCDPYSDDLDTDSAYRLSRAMLDTAKGDFTSVIQQLGPGRHEIPIMDAMDAVACVIRANAQEKLGYVDVAVALLEGYMQEGGAGGREVITSVVSKNPQLYLCTVSYPQAMSKFSQAAGSRAASGGLMLGGILAFSGLMAAGIPAIIMGVQLLTSPYFDPTDLIGVAIPGVIGLGLMVAGGLAIRNALRKKRVRTSGIQAQAQIVAIQPTGTTVNDVPQMQLVMQVQLEGQAPYQATTKLLMGAHQAAAFAPGTVVPVRVDPKDASFVVLENN